MADVLSFNDEIVGGNTLRFWIDDLTDAAGLPVTSGANPAIIMYDENDVEVATGTIAPAGDDADSYYADILIPEVTRTTKYVLKATADKNGAAYAAVGIIWAKPS